MALTTGEGDAAQLALALAGDRDAFRVLVERHSRTLFRLAFRMTGNEQDAEEVVQEAFLRAYRRLDRFESRANFGTWVYRIAVNCSLDLLRRRKPQEELRAPDDRDTGDEAVLDIATTAPAPDRLALSGEIGEQLNIALTKLSPMERAAFMMRHDQGMSIEEIARVLGTSMNATKNSVFRAVQKLRQELEPLVSRKR
ncbi:MAG: RNA polymerase sigma factor [Candidatus Acidiferrales bacterium]